MADKSQREVWSAKHQAEHKWPLGPNFITQVNRTTCTARQAVCPLELSSAVVVNKTWVTALEGCIVHTHSVQNSHATADEGFTMQVTADLLHYTCTARCHFRWNTVKILTRKLNISPYFFIFHSLSWFKIVHRHQILGSGCVFNVSGNCLQQWCLTKCRPRRRQWMLQATKN